ncbi:MAG: serpin family protein, partial [Myxococcota bacterium]
MRSHTSITLLITLTLVLGAGACGDSGSEQNIDLTPPGEQAQSELSRELAPAVPTAEQAALVEGNTAFAIDAYHQLIDGDDNLFYSPLSISTALAMIYAGAAGETASQMASALHYDLDADKLHPAFNWLDLELNSRGEGAQG